jgi:hypothetical protein
VADVTADLATRVRPRDGGAPAWLPPLPLGAALVALAVLLGWSGVEYVRTLAAVGARGTDFAQYYVAARLTLAHGWAAPYDVATFMTALHGLTGARDAYANLPVPTALAMALTRLPLGPAYAIWNAVLVGGFVAACWAAALGRGWERAVQLLASLAGFQVLSAIGLGQLGLAVGGLLVLHWWLLRDGRPVLAGFAAGLAFVKPQNVFLVPLALLLAGRVGAALACAAMAAGVGAACLVALGPAGLHAYLQSVSYEMQSFPAGRFTLNAALGGAVPALALAVAPLALAAIAARRARGHGPERPVVAGVLGSQLATPYLSGGDLALLVPCAWLTLRASPPRWLGWVAVGVNFVPLLADGPVRLLTIALVYAWLGALALLPALSAATGTDE